MKDLVIPETLIKQLHEAERVVAFTGAGISKESGIPTFREAQSGLWKKYQPEDLATPEAFQANPRRVWEWYTWRRKLIERAKPNLGHYALAFMERKVWRWTLITQNVDGLHQRAGSINVIELHGNIQRTRCANEGRLVTPKEISEEMPPRCRICGGLLRPDVVWFGEPLPSKALEDAFRAARSCQLFLAIGTSGIVQPAASLPFEALMRGATIVEVNPQSTPLSTYASFSLPYPSEKALPQLVRQTWPRSSG
jgi:NAD-dependent deacetylase